MRRLTHLCKRQLVDCIVNRTRSQHGRHDATRRITLLPRFHAERGVVVSQTVRAIVDIAVRVLVELELLVGHGDDGIVGCFPRTHFDHLGNGRKSELVPWLVSGDCDRHGRCSVAWLWATRLYEGRAKIVDNTGLFDVRLVTAPISIYPAVSATCDC